MLQAERNATERHDRLTGHIEALVPEGDLAPAVNALQALRGVTLIGVFLSLHGYAQVSGRKRGQFSTRKDLRLSEHDTKLVHDHINTIRLFQKNHGPAIIRNQIPRQQDR